MARNGLISGCAVNVPVGRARKGVMRPTNTLTAPNQKLTSTRAPKYLNESRAGPQLDPNAVTPGALKPAVPMPVAKPMAGFVATEAMVIAAQAPRGLFMNPSTSNNWYSQRALIWCDLVRPKCLEGKDTVKILSSV
jgi:hypothetical protein